MVASNTAGNLLLGAGMKRTAAGLVEALVSPLVLAGIGMLIVWTLARMHLLSKADLSFVLPVTSVGYVLNAWAGKVWLGEEISALRWVGTVLIVAGAALVGRTAER